MPGVEDGVAALGHEAHAEVGLPGSAQARRTVFVYQADEMDIVGLASRYERPAATEPAPPPVGTAWPAGRVEPANNRLESPKNGRITRLFRSSRWRIHGAPCVARTSPSHPPPHC